MYEKKYEFIILYTPKIFKSSPVITLIEYRIPTILRFSLRFGFDLNKTKSATPLFAKRPANAEESGKILVMYNSVRMMLEPQFGIRPIKAAINGVKKLVLSKMCLILSSPI